MQGLIGIAGRANSGKDVVADFLCRQMDARIMRCADPIKETLNTLFGFPQGAWDDREWRRRVLPMIGKTPRELAQTFGTDWGRQLVNEDIWVADLVARWRQAGCPLTVVPDVRFENEAEMIRKHGGLVLEIVRPDIEPDAPEHISEAGLPEALIHQRLINDSTIAALELKAAACIRELWDANSQ